MNDASKVMSTRSKEKEMALTKTADTPQARMTRARLFAGYEQAEMAELLGRSRNTISAWERGVNEPPFSVVARWAQITGQSLDWIAFGTEKESAPADTEAVHESRLWDLNPRPVLYEDTAISKKDFALAS